jgi:hypothetical protein
MNFVHEETEDKSLTTAERKVACEIWMWWIGLFTWALAMPLSGSYLTLSQPTKAAILILFVLVVQVFVIRFRRIPYQMGFSISLFVSTLFTGAGLGLLLTKWRVSSYDHTKAAVVFGVGILTSIMFFVFINRSIRNTRHISRDPYEGLSWKSVRLPKFKRVKSGTHEAPDFLHFLGIKNEEEYIDLISRTTEEERQALTDEFNEQWQRYWSQEMLNFEAESLRMQRIDQVLTHGALLCFIGMVITALVRHS